MFNITDYWPIAVGVVAVITWGIRLESLAQMNKREIEHTNDRVDGIHDDIRMSMGKLDARLTIIQTTLERIIWKLPVSKSEFNSDER